MLLRPDKRTMQRQLVQVPNGRLGLNDTSLCPLHPHLVRLAHRNIRAVTIGALLRGRLVKKYRFVVCHTGEFMAGTTRHITMRSLEREGSALVVIKQRRLPAGVAVTFGAWGNASGLGELGAVNVRVAVLALLRCGMEIHVDELDFEVGRLVTVSTGHGTMCPCKQESRLGVVEA